MVHRRVREPMAFGAGWLFVALFFIAIGIAAYAIRSLRDVTPRIPEA